MNPIYFHLKEDYMHLKKNTITLWHQLEYVSLIKKIKKVSKFIIKEQQGKNIVSVILELSKHGTLRLSIWAGKVLEGTGWKYSY